jgi:hypothetical protein
MYRSNTFTHRFSTEAACHVFISEVEDYIKRLMYQAEYGLIRQESSDIEITGDSFEEHVCTEHDTIEEDKLIEAVNTDNQDIENAGVVVVTLSAEGD